MTWTRGTGCRAGTAFAMNAEPFWEPARFIPTFGMLLGNMMASVALAVNYCLDMIALHKDQIELRLSFGATWWEASRPVAVEALRLAMLPTLNAMSVMGLITIPGMVQKLNGAPLVKDEGAHRAAPIFQCAWPI